MRGHRLTVALLPIAAFVLALFYYWFAIADRLHRLPLHDMGLPALDTTPFGSVTASRYWMAGLVAGGMVAVLYLGACWLIGRSKVDYRPPKYWQVCAVAGIPVLLGVPAITLTANTPTLPELNTAQTTLATLAGIGLAVAPSTLAARHPWRLACLAVDGWAIAGIILVVALSDRAVEMLERGSAGAMVTLAIGLLGSIGLLLVMTVLLAWKRLYIPKATELFVAGLCTVYLALPLIHHLAFTDGYYYITDSDNFFSRDPALQVAAWMVAALMALGVTAIRKALTYRLTDRCIGI